MKVLELFSGTHSVGKKALELGWEVVSVDLTSYKDFPEPTHKQDILKFDYKQYDHFDIIWASPPCTYFSQLIRPWIGRKRGKKGNKYIYTQELFDIDFKKGISWVEKTLEIINYFKPKYWFIENPSSGTLKKQEIMKGLHYTDVDYCRYCNWGYRKRTRIWTNVIFKGLLCEGKGKCPNMKGNKHKFTLGGHSKEQPSIGNGDNRTMKFRIPPDLITFIFSKLNFNITLPDM